MKSSYRVNQRSVWLPYEAVRSGGLPVGVALPDIDFVAQPGNNALAELDGRRCRDGFGTRRAARLDHVGYRTALLLLF